MTRDEAIEIIRRSDSRRKGTFAGTHTATDGVATPKLVAMAHRALAKGNGKKRSKKRR